MTEWVLGNLGLAPAARPGYEAYVEGQVLELGIKRGRDQLAVKAAISITYIHLNPARAGLNRIGQERLKGYRWSSYPWYLTRAGQWPGWLSTKQVMGRLRLGPQDRRGYEAYIEGRVLELSADQLARMPKSAPEMVV